MNATELRRHFTSLCLGPLAGRLHDAPQPLSADSAQVPASAQTLPQVLVYWAQTRPTQPLFHFLDIEDRLYTLTGGELYARSCQVASLLKDFGIAPGDRVLLASETGPDLLETFFGCALLGAVPCMASLPSVKAGGIAWRAALVGKARRVQAAALIVEAEFAPLAEEAFADPTGLPAKERPRVLSMPLASGAAQPLDPPATSSAAPAFMQFTSGTSATARAVAVSHRALLANARSLGQSSYWSTDDLMVGWLPLFHDMGLVATTLAPFVHGMPVVLTPPISFLLKPARWLWAIHYFRGTASFAPNFAYQLCLKRARDEELAGLDLSSWQLAYNAAEFVHASTIRQFAERFQSYGFNRDATIPSYGMAEMTVAVSVRCRKKPLVVDVISRKALAAEHRAVPSHAGDSDAMEVVGVGPIIAGHEVRIVDEQGQVLGERQEGEILLRGPSLFNGYYNEPDKTREVMQDGWLRTGDLGYLLGGELFICGRRKDLIIKAGANYYPYLLERAAERVTGVRAGCVAALGVQSAELGSEEMILVFETVEKDAAQIRQMSKAVEEEIFLETGLRPDRVMAVPPHTLPKTSSGKIQRMLVQERLQRPSPAA